MTIIAAETKLVLDLDEVQEYTSRRDMDAETALCRGLSEYCLSLKYDAGKGRFIKFLDAFSEWPDSEERAVYPSALVRSTGDTQYDASRMTPGSAARLGQSNDWVVVPCEISQTLELETWCTDTEQRQALTMMLEDAFNPTPDQYGFTLQVPFYHNAFARYSLESKRKLDNEGDVQRRYRKVVFTLEARIPLVRIFRRPTMQPNVRFEYNPSE